MCKVYVTFLACGCKDTALCIERCQHHLHGADLQTCDTMPFIASDKEAIVLSDPCTEHVALANQTESERRAKVPTAKSRRYLTAQEFNSLPAMMVYDPEDDTDEDIAAVLGLDAFQSLAGSLEGALPEVESADGEEDGSAFKSFKSMQSALPRVK